MRQVHIFISGFVQGVGFRAFVMRCAKKEGVVGWVKNLPDDRVEAVLQGDEKKVDTLLHQCNRGPFFSEVREVIVHEEDIETVYSEFKIIR